MCNRFFFLKCVSAFTLMSGKEQLFSRVFGFGLNTQCTLHYKIYNKLETSILFLRIMYKIIKNSYHSFPKKDLSQSNYNNINQFISFSVLLFFSLFTSTSILNLFRLPVPVCSWVAVYCTWSSVSSVNSPRSSSPFPTPSWEVHWSPWWGCS